MATLEEKTRHRILEVLFLHLPAEEWDVILFGSFARGSAGLHSDIDLAVQGPCALPSAEATRIIDALEESVPSLRDYDLVDLRKAPPALVKRIRKEGVPWNNATKRA